MEEKLRKYLKDRGVNDETIQLMSAEKIDITVIAVMDDSLLSAYLPLVGDRVSVRKFCQQHCQSDSGYSRKEALFQKLRQNLKKRKASCAVDGTAEEEEKCAAKCTGNAQKEKRNIEIGWLHGSSKDNLCQVRKKRGGGTRKVAVSKSSTRRELMDVALQYFFPDGESSQFGNLENFVCGLTDFKHCDVGCNDTVGKLYETTGLPMLRFYLTTYNKIGEISEESDSNKSVRSPAATCTFSAEVTDTEPSYGKRLIIPSATVTHSTELTRNSSEVFVVDDMDDPTPDNDSLDAPDSNWIPLGTPTVMMHVGTAATSGLVNVPYRSETSTPPSLQVDVVREDTFTEILLNLSAQLCHEDRKNVINVDRHDVLQCAYRAVNRKYFNPFAGLTIRFTGEDGIDDGGLTREFLRLTVADLQRSQVFCGSINERFLSMDYAALENRMYEHAGKVMSLSLLHNGPLPAFLNKHLYWTITGSVNNAKPTVEDVKHVDGDLHNQLLQLQDAETAEQYSTAVTVLEELICLAGCASYMNSIDRVKLLLKSLCHFICIGRAGLALDQFKCGLEFAGVLEAVRQHPEAMEAAFIFSQRCLDATAVEALFEVQWSQTGSNRFQMEKTTITFWRDFLQDCEYDGKLGQLLIFVTGLSDIPPLGFVPKPRIIFGHEDQCVDDDYTREFPVANTCSLQLRLPVLSSYERFCSHMLAAIEMNTFTAA